MIKFNIDLFRLCKSQFFFLRKDYSEPPRRGERRRVVIFRFGKIRIFPNYFTLEKYIYPFRVYIFPCKIRARAQEERFLERFKGLRRRINKRFGKIFIFWKDCYLSKLWKDFRKDRLKNLSKSPTNRLVKRIIFPNGPQPRMNKGLER